uniref:Odorant binding protein OBP25 n=1 Tax=Sitodiplosis mosellana TaxID=263140 RepID=A0A977WK74_9DIPT|nr:odorant binding protein OBP25 [Sitodiplosis mosellana]
MKIFLCILVLSFATMQALVVAKRGGHRFDPNMCCNAEKSEPDSTAHEAMKKLFDECKKELGNDGEEGKKQPGKRHCIAECVSKKMNVLNADGTINEAEFTNNVKKMATAPYQQAVAEDVAKKCIAGANTATDNGSKGDDKCSSIPMKLKHCIGKEMFNACPADEQDTSDKCVEMRKKINGEKPKEE